VLSASCLGQAGPTFSPALLLGREKLSFLHSWGKDSGFKCPWKIQDHEFLEKESSLLGPEEVP